MNLSRTSQALWFGPPARPLFGRFHIPADGLARGAVLLCPPFDLEAQEVALAYRLLAEDLRGRRFAVMHLDYDGTGDSAGTNSDPERVRAWQTSIVEAVNLFRSSGAGHISIVAMRFGATLAASVAARSGADALVMWDPCDSGRSYLREQALLRSVHESDQGLQPRSSPAGEPGHIETLGSTFDRATAAQMSALAIEALPLPLAPSVLVLMRPERPLRDKLITRLAKEHVEFGTALGQDRLLSAWTVRSEVPQGTMTDIVTWLEREAPDGPAPISVVARETAQLNCTGYQAVTERAQVTPDRGLFMISSEPMEVILGRTVIFLNVGRTDHTGPARLWVDLARYWASMGLRVVRADLSGLGQSPARPGREADRAYPPEAVDDIRDILQSVAPGRPGDVVLVGLCSGGYHSALAALEMPVGGVIAINPGFPGEVASEPENGAGGPTGTEPPDRDLYQIPRWLRAKDTGKAWLRRYVPVYRRLRQPAGAVREMKWWLLNRARDGRRPVLLFKQAAEAGANTVVIFRPSEAELFSRGERALLRRLGRRDRFRVEIVDDSDHTLYMQRSRRTIVPILTRHVLDGLTLAPPSTEGQQVEDQRAELALVER